MCRAKTREHPYYPVDAPFFKENVRAPSSTDAVPRHLRRA